MSVVKKSINGVQTPKAILSPKIAFPRLSNARVSYSSITRHTRLQSVDTSVAAFSHAIAPITPSNPSNPSTLETSSTSSDQLQFQQISRILNKCRTAFAILAFCAVWMYLSPENASHSLFASVSTTISAEPMTGVQSAIKSSWAGFAAGVLHTLCGPDHLAALTPLTIGRNKGAATALGALWGFGHSTGQLLIGLVFVLLKDRFDDFLPALSKWAGVVVGLTLIAIGLLGIYESYFARNHQHAEEEQQAVEKALAGVDAGPPDMRTAAKFGLATYATGIAHGLQPDALFVVIPALALPTKMAVVAYCSMFVIGTVAAMGGYTLLIGTASGALIKQKPWLESHLSNIACAIAIVVGFCILLSGFGIEVPFL